MSSWHALIQNHIKCNDFGKALDVYQTWQSQEGSISRGNSSSLVSLLIAFSKLKDHKNGIRLHGLILREGLLTSHCCYLGNALVDMYAKSGMLLKAQEVFDNLPRCDLVTWNVLMAGYVRHGQGRETLNRFSLMETRSILPDVITFTCVLKACGSIKDVESGRHIHDSIERRGLLDNNRNLAIGNALIDMYGKCGFVAEAKDVFEMLPDRNVVSWTTVITFYVQEGCYEEALYSYRQMRSEGILPDEILLVCVLKACGGVRDVEECMEMHAYVETMGFLRSNVVVGTAVVYMYAKCGMLAESKIIFRTLPFQQVVMWNALISGCVRHGRAEEALDYYQEMHRHGISPDDYTLTCILKACGMIGAFEKGRKIHVDIEKKGFLQTSQHVGNAVVAMYVKCGMVANASKVFNTLRIRNVVSWNILIAGYAQGGELGEVLYILEGMKGEGIKPSSVTFISVLNACSHVGLVDKGETYFEAMAQSYGVTPTLEHQSCLVDILGRAGQLENVAFVMNITPSLPNTVMWLTMLSACRKWGDVRLGRNAFEQVVSIDGNNSASYMCMHKIYVGASMEE